jgi:cell wall-associated protease
MGGEAAVSANVENALKGLGVKCERVSGATRVETSLLALQDSYLDGNTANTVIIATGYNFADSLSISPYSYAFNYPIVLTQANGTLSDAALATIRDNAYITKAIIVGGPSAVNGTVEGQLDGIGITHQRIQGANRYETSKNIADYICANSIFDYKQPVLATGTNFPDALAGASLAGVNGSVTLLVNSTSDATVSAILANKALIKSGGFYYVLGGSAAVSDSLVNHIDNILK